MKREQTLSMSDNVTIIDAEVSEEQTKALVPLTDQPPTVLPGIVQDELVPFPGPMIPIIIDSKLRQEAILHAKSHAGFFLLLNRSSPSDDPAASKQRSTIFDPMAATAGFGVDLGGEPDVLQPDEDGVDIDLATPIGQTPEDVVEEPLGELAEVSQVGILARVMKVLRLPDGRMSALVHLLRRAQPLEMVRNKPFPVFRVTYPSEIVSDEETFEAAYRQVRLTLQAFFEDHPSVPDEVKITALAIESPGILADFVAQHLSDMLIVIAFDLLQLVLLHF